MEDQVDLGTGGHSNEVGIMSLYMCIIKMCFLCFEIAILFLHHIFLVNIRRVKISNQIFYFSMMEMHPPTKSRKCNI